MASTTRGTCSSNPHRELFIQPPNNAHCSSRGSRFDQLQLAAVAKELLDRVQLTARSIDHSGSVTRSLQCNRSGSVGERLVWVQLEPNASHPCTYVYERNVHRSAPDHPP